MELTLTGLFYVFVAATLAPVALSLVPWLPLPSVVLEVLLGVALGPLALGLVAPNDEVIAVLALLGVSLLLFFAGLELDLRAIVNPRMAAFTLPALSTAEARNQHRDMVRRLGAARDTL